MNTHRTIEIDPSEFKDRVPSELADGKPEYYFDEGDVLKFLIDQMNAAKINISMILHDHELEIEYQGLRESFSMGISSLDAPETAVVDGMAELANVLNEYENIESWIAYKNGKHSLHILRKSYVATATELGGDTVPQMTPLETREAEDNIEAC